MNRLYFVFLAFCAFSASKIYAQSDDFGMDFGVEAGHKLAKGLKLGLEGNVRTQDNSRRIERYGIGMDLSYKFFSTRDKKWDAKVAGGFEYMWVQNLSETSLKADSRIVDGQEIHTYNVQERYWRNRHRTSLGLSLNYTPNKRWSFQLKETVQYSHYACKDSVGVAKYRFNDDDELYLKQPLSNAAKPSKDKFVLRNKISVTYDIPGCKIDPYVSVDYGVGLGYVANKWKYTLGADYKLSKTSKLTVAYRYNTEDDDEEPNGHLVSIGYSFDF